MLIEELLDKTERKQYQLLCLLNEVGETMQVDEVLEKVHLTKVTLNKYIDDINYLSSEKRVDLNLELTDSSVNFHAGNQVEWQEIIYMFLNQSPKYPMIIYLFNNRDFSIKEISRKLSISEATVNRQIYSLNKILKEFQLMIRNGQLVGPEHQIRYFFYQLFLKALPEQYLTQLINDKNTFHHVSQIENVFDMNFSVMQKYQISLWLLITLKRRKVVERDYSEIEKLMVPYKDHIFYRKIYQQSRTIFKNYKMEFNEGEAMSIFSFFISMEIFTPPMMEKFLGFGGPIMEATRLGIKTMKHVAPQETNINENAMYEISQIFSTMYFFNGDILWGSKNEVFGKNIINEFLHFEVRDDAEHLFEEALFNVFNKSADVLGDLVTSSQHRVLFVLSYMMEEKIKNIHIAVDAPKNVIYTQPLMNTLKYYFEQNHLIHIERYDTNLEYDLIISQYNYRPYANENVYYLKGNISRYDIQHLTRLIDKLLIDR